MMPPLNLPGFEYEVRNQEGNTMIFDAIRKKHVVLTPEEWVRQHFVHYLIRHLQYPKSLIKMERGHAYNALRKRTDILIYNRSGAPFMLIECKASHIKIEQKVFEQVSVYNKSIQAKYLVVTNGLKHYCCEINHDSNTFKFLQQIPMFG